MERGRGKEEEGTGKKRKVMGWEGGTEERGKRAFYNFCEEV